MKRWIVRISFGILGLISGATRVHADEAEAIAALEKLDVMMGREDDSPDKPPEAAIFFMWDRVYSGEEIEEAVRCLNQIPSIADLHLETTKIKDSGVTHLKDLRNIRRLNLSVTGIGDAGLKALETMTELRVIDLTITKVTAKGVASLKKALPRAKVLHSDFRPQSGDVAKLQGRWREKIVAGLEPSNRAPYSLVVVGQDLALFTGEYLTFHSRFTVRPDRNPREVDLPFTTVLMGFNSRWKSEEAIYKFEGDDLILCTRGGRRPTRFDRREGNLLKFERTVELPKR